MSSDSGASPSDSLFTEFTTKITEALSKTQTLNLSSEPPVASIGIKLDGTNYALWSQVVEMYISGKDKLGYINGDLPQPPSMDLSFRKWRTDNAIVKGWLINSMDSSLIGNFIRFPTAKMVWDSIATTYFDGSDTSQVYDLRHRVMQLKQAGGSLEKYYNDLQGLWREIDFRRPNPMECAVDIHKYNSILQEDRVYVFLDGLDDRLDKIRADMLQLRPFPTVEQAYAHVRREAIRQTVMITGSAEAVPGAVLTTKGLRLGPTNPTSTMHNGKPKSRVSSEGLKCTHCGHLKHTHETCFKLHGYPDWWNDLQAKKRRATTSKDEGTAAMANAELEPHLSLTPSVAHGSNISSSTASGNLGCVCFSSPGDVERGGWLLDSGATDHMTFDAKDFTQNSLPRRTNIANANGIISPVTGACTVTLTPTLQLPNTLLVPSLSHKLLSVSQVTSELNCIVIMYPDFCLLQDILTKEIIGRGTKRGGLYYMEDFSVGSAHHMRNPVGVEETEIWLWHRRLGHPDTFKLSVKPGKTNLLRLINAALNDELFFRIANHTLNVVEADATYIKPFQAETILITPVQTTNVLLQDQAPLPPCFISHGCQALYATGPGTFDNSTTAGILKYERNNSFSSSSSTTELPLFRPTLPPLNDTSLAANFTERFRSLANAKLPANVPQKVDKRCFFTVGLGTSPCPNNQTCQGPNGTKFAASVHNISFIQPTTALFQAHFFGQSNGDTSIIGEESHPLHLHGFNFYVVGQGFGNYDPKKDPSKVNLVDPVERNTVGVPSGGWVAIRFFADNPGHYFIFLTTCMVHALSFGSSHQPGFDDGMGCVGWEAA
ncbi:hypothetical protein MRB53_028196 [Persea americana]|uniref:Uncharacterized protein n=1 Tax=Persea americana TaxID=3435 RepID=A0ACC2KFC5_PERAE|nr:hypothetical protein MRB53_028196 [Persea americana]